MHPLKEMGPGLLLLQEASLDAQFHTEGDGLMLNLNDIR